MASQALSQTDIKRTWFTISSLVSKDFKLKYRRSILGVVWSVLNPLLMMVVMAAVFSSFFKFDIPYYPVYIILGNTLFSLMADSTSMAMRSIIDSAPLIKKVRIDKLVFPLQKILFQLVNFCISLVAVVAVVIYFRIPPDRSMIALPVLIFYVILFSAGIGMALAAGAVFFRDFIHLWSVVITAWTYATPLFYPFSILPPEMQAAEVFNPMYHYVTYFRSIVIEGIAPGVSENLTCLAMAVLTFFVGLFIFRKAENKFILYV